jgi:hypothetical protein
MRSEAHEKACEEAAEFARQFVLREAEKADLTLQKILKGIVEDMDAEEEKVFFDKDRNRCVKGPKQRAYSARAKARDQAISILGIKAPEKIEASGSVNLDHELTPALQEVFDKIYSRGKVDQKRKPRKL